MYRHSFRHHSASKMLNSVYNDYQNQLTIDESRCLVTLDPRSVGYSVDYHSLFRHLSDLFFVRDQLRRQLQPQLSHLQQIRESITAPSSDAYRLPGIIIWQLICSPYNQRFAIGVALIL